MISFRHAGLGVAAAILVAAPNADAEAPEALTLAAAIERADARSEQILAVRARRDAADARVAQGKAALWPRVTASATASRRDASITLEEDGPDVAFHETSFGAQVTGSL